MTLELRGIDVFDGFKLSNRPDIFTVNDFLWNATVYEYFIFNDIIYKVGRPNVFNIESFKTDIKIKDLK